MAQGRILLIGFLVVALTALTSLAARRLRIPQSILLVIIGAALAFAPGFARVSLHPDLVLLGLLPPLLYTSGVGMSWRGFKRNLRPIMLLAIGCVLFTASAVAMATHWLLHLPWSIGFVLGAVVSPPDAVAPMAIARRLEVPKRILTVLEGEDLLTLYQWNTRRAKHYFCCRCGIYVFHRKRAAPDHFGINVFCLENFDIASVPVPATEGATMTVEDPSGRTEWPGPRRLTSDC